MKKALLIHIVFLLSFSLEAQNISSTSSIDKVIKSRIKAVLKITVYNKDLKQLTTGAGFYYGSSGNFLTSHHIIKEFLRESTNKIQLKRFDGSYLTSLTLNGCKNQNNIDACLFKDNSKAKTAYFPIKEIKIGKGHDVIMAGFCDSEKHSSKKGKIIDYFSDTSSKFKSNRDSYNQKIKMVQTSVSQCPGDSGGPLFNSRGELVGMATNIMKSDLRQFNLSIHSNELLSFAKSVKKSPKLVDENRLLKTSKAKAKLLLLIK